MTKKASGCKVIFYKFFLYKICMMYTYFPIKMRIDDFACYRTSRETSSIDRRIYKVLSKDPGDKESRILYLYIFWKQIIINYIIIFFFDNLKRFYAWGLGDRNQQITYMLNTQHVIRRISSQHQISVDRTHVQSIHDRIRS